ncbi:MAG: glycosyltransferase, partial [Candidatus Aminicenantes bacterium]
MLKKPKVSIVMPVFNGQSYLNKAIESILGQSYENIEFIIINDGSTDKTEETIKSYEDNRIRLVSRENRGLIASLNEGISIAKGKYIARQDDDDISALNRIKKQVEFLEKNKDIVIVGCDTELINKDGKIVRRFYKPQTADQVFVYLPFYPPFMHGSVMIRAEILKSNSSRYGNYEHAEDYDLWYRLLKVGKGANLKEFLYQYRVHQKSVSSKHKKIQISNSKIIRKNIVEYYKSDLKLYEKWTFSPFLNESKELQDDEAEDYAKICCGFVDLLIKLKDYKKASEQLDIANEISPLSKKKYNKMRFKLKIRNFVTKI